MANEQVQGGKMRLICPNCGAQYEVPDGVIPDSGRDVQCSNCGNTWFQHHPDNDPGLTEELQQSAPIPEAEAEPMAEPVPQPAETSQAAAEAPKRRSLDPSIADVLREEAAREARARAAETAPLESQPDLGLDEAEDEAERRARQVRDRMARMKGLPDEPPASPEEAAAEDNPVSRRDLLPDIEEINSSLRATSDRRPAAAADHELPGEMPTATVTAGNGGFRRGFLLSLIVVALFWAAYAMAPQISAQVPALEPILTSYVTVVDQARNWLDEQVRDLLMRLDQMSSEQSG